jgi:DNA-binding GntR family transcriptional regulator
MRQDHMDNPLRSGRHAAQAYHAIQELILRGGLMPGEKASHRGLAANVNAGRGAVRDAILRLEAEGLLEQRQKSGVSLRGLAAAEIADVYRLRAVVEPLFAERAAIRGDARHTATLETLCDEMEALVPMVCPAGVLDRPSWRRSVQLDMQFHAVVIDAAGDWLVKRFYRHEHVLALHGAWYMQLNPVTFDHDHVAARDHREIAAAIRARDPSTTRGPGWTVSSGVPPGDTFAISGATSGGGIIGDRLGHPRA